MEVASGDRSLKQNCETRWYALELQAESVRSLRYVQVCQLITMIKPDTVQDGAFNNLSP